MCNFHAYNLENAYIKDFDAWRILMNILCIYLEGEGKGGLHLCIYIYRNTVSLFYRTASWIFTKLRRDEVHMAPHMCKSFSAKSIRGRIQGRARIGQWGAPSRKDFFVGVESYSN